MEQWCLRWRMTGVGIPEDKLTVIRKIWPEIFPSARKAMEYFNVNERIRLYFGDDYGVTIDSVAVRGQR